jgi:hypothetical protein
MECRTSIAIAGIAAAFLAFATHDAVADDYFKGKDITIYVGSTSGGPYDAYARMLARLGAATSRATRTWWCRTCPAPVGGG